MSLLAEMNSKALQVLEAHRHFFCLDEAPGGFRRREIQILSTCNTYRVNSINKLGEQVDTAKSFSKIH